MLEGDVLVEEAERALSSCSGEEIFEGRDFLVLEYSSELFVCAAQKFEDHLRFYDARDAYRDASLGYLAMSEFVDNEIFVDVVDSYRECVEASRRNGWKLDYLKFLTKIEQQIEKNGGVTGHLLSAILE